MGSISRQLRRQQDAIRRKEWRRFFATDPFCSHPVERALFTRRCKACGEEAVDHRDYRFCLFGPNSEEFVLDTRATGAYGPANSTPPREHTYTAAQAQVAIVRFLSWDIGLFDSAERARLEGIAKRYGFTCEIT